jgi:hypothetical protein
MFIAGKLFGLAITESRFSALVSCLLIELPQETNARTTQDDIKISFLKVLMVKKKDTSFMFYFNK